MSYDHVVREETDNVCIQRKYMERTMYYSIVF